MIANLPVNTGKMLMKATSIKLLKAELAQRQASLHGMHCSLMVKS